MKMVFSVLLAAFLLPCLSPQSAFASADEFKRLCNDSSLAEPQRTTIDGITRRLSYEAEGRVLDCESLTALLQKHTSLELDGGTFFYVKIADLAPIATLDWLTELSIADQPRSDDLSPLAGLKLKSLVVSAIRIGSLDPLARIPELESLKISLSSGVSAAPIGSLKSLKNLELDFWDADAYELDDLVSAESLSDLTMLSPPEGTLLSLAEMTQLKHLTLQQPKLANLDALADLHLESLDIEGGSILNLQAVRTLKSLTSFSATNAGIMNIDFLRHSTALKHLDLHVNQIYDAEPIAGLTNLETLDLTSNRISVSRPFEGMTKLRELSVARNQLISFSVWNLTNLEVLDLSLNQLYGQPGLTDKHTKLVSLHLGANSIGGFDEFPNLTSLKEFDLNGNKVTDVTALAKLVNLEHLNLADNKITDLSSLRTLTKLQRLELYSNVLPKPVVCPVQPQSICIFN